MTQTLWHSFASVSYIFPMAKFHWWLAEVRVMSRQRRWGNRPGEKLCCNSFPQLLALHEWEQPHTVSCCQTLHSRDVFSQALSLNNQTMSESQYWYFDLFIRTKALNNPEPIHLLQRWSTKWSVFFSVRGVLFLLFFQVNCLASHIFRMQHWLANSITSLK